MCTAIADQDTNARRPAVLRSPYDASDSHGLAACAEVFAPGDTAASTTQSVLIAVQRWGPRLALLAIGFLEASPGHPLVGGGVNH